MSTEDQKQLAADAEAAALRALTALVQSKSLDGEPVGLNVSTVLEAARLILAYASEQPIPAAPSPSSK